MKSVVPRILISGTSSGCGKTTVCCAVMKALADRGLRVGAQKCGPDYIDPMFHAAITGEKGANLDGYFFDDDTLAFLFQKNARGKDISIIEGVMGCYDGIGMTDAASAHDISVRTRTPVVLVVPAKGSALSAIALLEGFVTFSADNLIRGVIFNRCTPSTYAALARETEKRFAGRVRPLGFMPDMPECALESRRLGLVTAREVGDLHEKLGALSRQAEKSIDIDALLSLAVEAAPIEYKNLDLPRFEGVRIAVARDEAFLFYYEDSLSALESMGAELVDFSPLYDGALPENIHGLYIGGGYPELYAEKLSKNAPMREAVKAALTRGLPCIAECGGFMYLTEYIGKHPMVGFISGKSSDAGALPRFGYVELTAKRDCMLCRAGEKIRAHEFHYWDSDFAGGAFEAKKPTGRSWDCVFAGERLYAGYPHFHFYANTRFAVNFYKTCLEEKHKND
ncbi:MAG: cobyrinate a,c-diamide synthase [Clostridia bacterium]|nr:cobyrinate a,c-diamide synthase [Clostridia bacterium]